MPQDVHYADNVMLATEAHLFMGLLHEGWDIITKAPIIIQPLQPKQAEEALVGDISNIKLDETLASIIICFFVLVVCEKIYSKMVLINISLRELKLLYYLQMQVQKKY